MTTRHLKIFEAVYTTGSMTAAAKKLYMTQPSVSQAIRELEDHYDTRLFERLYRKLYPTASGEKLYQYARQIIGMFDEMESSLRDGAKASTLELGLFFTAGMLVQPWLQEFRRSFPTTDVHVQVWKGSELKRLLRCAELDVAIMEESTKDPDLVQEIIAEDRLVAVTAQDDPLVNTGPISVEELIQHPLLLREQGAGVRDQFDAQLRELGFSVRPQWESASTLVLLDAARHQEGIAILPYELARTALELEDVKELTVTGIDLQRRMALTWHRDKYITAAMQCFMDIVRTVGTPHASEISPL
jgi:DNA-binding transcriptional LysR family regulator